MLCRLPTNAPILKQQRMSGDMQRAPNTGQIMLEQTIRHIDSAIRFKSTVHIDFLKQIHDVLVLYTSREDDRFWQQMVNQHESFLESRTYSRVIPSIEEIKLPPHTD